MEFFELANEYGVSGVPHTTINRGSGYIVGAVPEKYLLEEIKRVMTQKSENKTSSSGKKTEKR